MYITQVGRQKKAWLTGLVGTWSSERVRINIESLPPKFISDTHPVTGISDKGLPSISETQPHQRPYLGSVSVCLPLSSNSRALYVKAAPPPQPRPRPRPQPWPQLTRFSERNFPRTNICTEIKTLIHHDVLCPLLV